MILAINAYLQAHPQASLLELGLEFNVSKDALLGVIDVLVQKGWVKRSRVSSACHDCDCACQACPLTSSS